MLFLELAVVLILILLNGVLAMAELAIVSSRRARLQALIDRDVHGSRRAMALATDPGRFLSTVQTGITMVGVLSGAFSGATLGARLSEGLAALGLPHTAADAVGVGAVVALITYVSLIVGELVPKQIALRDPEAIAVRAAPAMTLLARIGAPVVWLLDASGDAVLRMLGYHAEPERRVTEEEVRILIAEAETAGVLEPGERAIISGVMRLGDRPVRAVMTPRLDVEMLDLSVSAEEIRAQLLATHHSRLPVYSESPEEMIGVVQAKDLLDAYLRGETPDVRAHVRNAPIIPDTVDALDAVTIMRKAGTHMALVHDEYGHFEGVVTNADVLDAIVGTPQAGHGQPEPDAVQRDDGSWLISGSMAAEPMAELLAIDLPPERKYETAAGFTLSLLGHLPEVGEAVDAFGWRFEIVDLDGRRIDKLLVKRIGRRRAARHG
jgi:putative hemolysin